MQTNAQKINDFHHALGGEWPDKPVVPSAETLTLRRTLIREEYEEVLEAFAELEQANGSPEIALAHLMHELADLLYVTYGAFTACGVDADAVFSELHRANMQKANGPRRADGKVMKPPDFIPADVASIIFPLHNL